MDREAEWFTLRLNLAKLHLKKNGWLEDDPFALLLGQQKPIFKGKLVVSFGECSGFGDPFWAAMNHPTWQMNHPTWQPVLCGGEGL